MGSTRDDKEQIGYDSALCRREATEDHRSRASEYEWSVGATLLRRNLQERDGVPHGGPHATQAFPISPDSLCSGFEVRGFQKRLNSAPRLAFDFIEGV